MITYLTFKFGSGTTCSKGPYSTISVYEWKIIKIWGGAEEEGDGVWYYTKIRFGRRFGLEDQILLGLAKLRFVYTSYLYFDYLWLLYITENFF